MNAVNSLRARSKVFARDTSWKSWWFIFSTAFLLGTASIGTFSFLPMAVRLVSSVFTGLLIVRLFVIYHDQQHHAILPKSNIAEFLMRVFGIWVLCPSSIWRGSHDYHHAHNSKLRSAYIGSYPIMTSDQYQKSSKSERFAYLFIRHPLTILAGYVTVFLFGMVIIPFFTSPRRHLDCLLAFIMHLTLGFVLWAYGGWSTVLLCLIFPRVLAGCLGSYLFYAQHNFPEVTFGDKDGWTFEKAALQSSSHMKTGPIMAWFSGNIGYHHIHHLNHRIPFYRLPEVFNAMSELRNAKTTTLWPSDIVRCLRLKVWCVKTQRMTPLPVAL